MLLVLLAIAISLHFIVFIYLLTGDIGRLHPLDKRTNIDVDGQNTFYLSSVLIMGVELRTRLNEDYMEDDFKVSFQPKPEQYLDDVKIKDGRTYHLLTYGNKEYAIEYRDPDGTEFYQGIWKYLSDGYSSGLMLTLQRLQSKTEEDITAGYRITGTGAYAPCMRVDMVANVDEKLKAAHSDDMDYFLIAGDNYEEAERIKAELGLDIEIIPVFFIQEAVEFLEQIK